MPKRPNEESVRTALVQILPAVTGTEYQSVCEPDSRNSSTPDVDFLFIPADPAARSVAIEHTVVEAYDGQIAYVGKSYEVVQNVNRLCADALPGDRYFFVVVPEPRVAQLNRRTTTGFAGDLAEQIRTIAPSLSIDDYVRVDVHGEAVLLICSGSLPELNGKIHRMPGFPNDQPSRFSARLWTAFEHGLSKFPPYRRAGNNTLLALEDLSSELPCDPVHNQLFSVEQFELINRMIDYVVLFRSVSEEMVVANVWKTLDAWYDVTPYHHRFSNQSGVWISSCDDPNAP